MHRRPRLNEFGRRLISERLESGRSASVAADELGVSRATVYKWWHRYRLEGLAGLPDRPSRPLNSPRRLSQEAEETIVSLRREQKLGPHRLAALTGHHRWLERYEGKGWATVLTGRRIALIRCQLGLKSWAVASV